MFDAFLGIARLPLSGMQAVEPIVTTLFEEGNPNIPDRVVALVSPYADWSTFRFNENTVAWWAAAALAVPYTEEVCQSVVDTLLQLASVDHLDPYIPVDLWVWLKKRPSLPPMCKGRVRGTMNHAVRRIRELGDVEILESYLLLVWSEWDAIHPSGLIEMCALIREDFGGIGMGRHREVLTQRLDHVLGQLDRGFGHFTQHNPLLDEHHIQVMKERYGELKVVLLEVDREALEALTRTSSRLFNLFNLLTPADVHRIPLEVCLCAPSPMSVAACQ